MRNRTDIIGSVLLIIIGTGVVIESIRLKLGTPLMPQPGFFPFVGGSLLIGLALVLVQGWRQRDESTRHPGKVIGTWRRPVILVVGMGVYTALLESLGYVLPTVLISAVTLRILGVTSWKILILASLGLSVGAYFLFGRILASICRQGSYRSSVR